MSFQEVQFPTNIRYSSSGGPQYNTEVIVLQSGHEQRNGNWSIPRHAYNINALKNGGDIQTVLDFFHAMRGRLHGFRFKDWSDFTSNDGTSAVAATDQPLSGVVDGVNDTFQCVKEYTIGSETLTRTITKIVSGTFVLAVDGVPTGSGWTLDYNTGIVTFTVAPTVGKVLTAGFEFDVPVRFDTDHLDMEQSYFETVTFSLPIIELRV